MQLEFAQRGWIHAIWLVLAVTALTFWFQRRGSAALDRLVSRTMQMRLVARPSLWRRWSATACLGGAMAALVVALMGPQWGTRLQTLTRVDSQVMICLDVSRSMLAEDVAPNRLDRAKAELDSLLGLMEEGQQVGLIAFAGKAAVLCPMTTDFGFLRLVLAEAVPQSVGLGGTRIGEALSRAVDGFGDAGDLNRVILMITDGEDHESFPLDAAKRARERGIRVISIGFGDEAGSKIEVTDPRSGIRSFVKDRDGEDVVSRLDGEMLRNIALETEGVYIPAGTGALDLESIYARHIDSLLRGATTDQQQVLKNEAYQWCVLVALSLLFVSLVMASPWSLSKQVRRQLTLAEGSSSPAVLVCCVLALSLGADLVRGQSPPADVEPPATAEDAAPPTESSESVEKTPEKELSPREAYNQALPLIPTNPDRAERLLQQARRSARADGEVRYRALYNLGWVEVERADQLLEDEPAEALQHLEMAVDRFREAIRIRPDSLPARKNLEILSRRVLELADSLKASSDDLAAQLDAALARQRETQAELAQLVQQARGAEPVLLDNLRPSFRQAAVVQRQTIADLQRLAEDVRKQQSALEQQTEEQRSDEQRLQAMQLPRVEQYLDLALQRLQKSRALTRRVQGNRAFSRWSAGLTATKRARDQLRNPVEILGVLAADAVPLAELTRRQMLAATLASDDDTPPASTLPAWLTLDWLQESQAELTERMQEVTSALDAMAASAASPADADAGADADASNQVQPLLKQVSQALPLLKSGAEAFSQATRELEAAELSAANERQWDGIQSLQDALEFFIDLRRLIEVMHRDQQGLRDTLAVAQQTPEGAEEFVASARSLVDKNLARGGRLAELLQAEEDKLPKEDDAVAGAADPPPSPERQRIAQARLLLEAVQSTLSQLRAGVAPPQEVDEPPAENVEQLAQQGLDQLHELRRLFFSIVEHLRETGQRQLQLRDDTNELAGQPDEPDATAVGPLAGRQAELQQLTEQIAQALSQQAQGSAEGAPQGQEMDESRLQQLAEAGKLVDAAQYEMQMAVSSLEAMVEAPQGTFQEPLDRQQVALEKIAAALALLDESPPRQDPPQQDQEQNQQQDEQQQQDQQQQQQQQQQQDMDASQLLQLVRDREAQRRRERQRAQRAAGGGVEKDW